MTDELEHALRAMLDEQSDAVPLIADAPHEVIGRARRRRSLKLGAFSGGGVAALVLVIGLVVAANDDSNSIDLVPATTSDTPAPEGRVLDPGAIVAARSDGRIVELDQQGNELRELYDAGERVEEIDVVPGGRALYVRTSGEDSCGEVLRIDLTSGIATRVGAAAGMAVSGNGRFLALSANSPTGPGALTCSSPTRAVLIVDLVGGDVLHYWDGPEWSLNPRASRDVSLDYDGTHLVYEACYEGCAVRIVEVPVDCLIDGTECDVVDPWWDDHRVLDDESRGVYQSLDAPQFANGGLYATECECSDEPETSIRHLVAFDPNTGERLGRVAPFAQPFVADYVLGPADLLITRYLRSVAGGDGVTIASVGDRVTVFSGILTAIALVPPPLPTTARPPTAAVPNTTTPTPGTDALFFPDPLSPGSIVAARPDGTIIELDAAGNQIQVLFKASPDVQEIDVARDPDVLYVRKGDQLCGPVSEVALATGSVRALGTAGSVAISVDGQWLALGGRAIEDRRVACDEGGGSSTVVVRGVVTGADVEFRSESQEGALPDFVSDLALSADGSRIAITRCWEECSVLLGAVPSECLAAKPTCGYMPVKWSELTALDHDIVGYGGVGRSIAFSDGLLLVGECDGDDATASDSCRLVEFDATTGERGAVSTLAPRTTLLAASADTLVVSDAGGVKSISGGKTTPLDDIALATLVPA